MRRFPAWAESTKSRFGSGRRSVKTTVWSSGVWTLLRTSSSVLPNKVLKRPLSVAIPSATICVMVWTTSFAVNSPQPKWNGTPLRSLKVQVLASGVVISQDVASPGTSSPVRWSVSTRGSAKFLTIKFVAKLPPRQGKTTSTHGAVVANFKRSTVDVDGGVGMAVGAGAEVAAGAAAESPSTYVSDSFCTDAAYTPSTTSQKATNTHTWALSNA